MKNRDQAAGGDVSLIVKITTRTVEGPGNRNVQDQASLDATFGSRAPLGHPDTRQHLLP